MCDTKPLPVDATADAVQGCAQRVHGETVLACRECLGMSKRLRYATDTGDEEGGRRFETCCLVILHVMAVVSGNVSSNGYRADVEKGDGSQMKVQGPGHKCLQAKAQ